MRTAFIQQLIEEARRDKTIFLLTADLGYSVLEPFRDEFPDRFLNVGIAEQNMVGIATGLALDGWNVFIYSIANFPTLRCLEQIRYDVCYHNLKVKIVSVGAGFFYGALGASHHGTEDIAIMRALPNMVVASPTDTIETKLITCELAKHDTPCYLRLGKGENIHKDLTQLRIGGSIEFRKPKWIRPKNGDSDWKLVSVIFCGSVGNLDKFPPEYGLYSFPYIKPMDRLMLNLLHRQDLIVLEDHQKMGGLGSAVLETYNDMLRSKEIKKIPNIEMLGINDVFMNVTGNQDYLRSRLWYN